MLSIYIYSTRGDIRQKVGADITSYLADIITGFMTYHHQLSASPRTDSDITPRPSVYYLLHRVLS